MKRAAVLALATAVSVAGIAETTPEARAAEAPPATRSLDQIRAEALTAMRNGDLQEVRKRGNRGWRGGKRSVTRAPSEAATALSSPAFAPPNQRSRPAP